MTTATATLAEFLLARLTDDEAVARAATPGPWLGWQGWFEEDSPKGTGPDGACVLTSQGEVVSEWHVSSEGSRHIARHDPARVLADCAARRAIVEAAGRASALYEWAVGAHGESSDPDVRDEGDVILRHLAAPYASHPDYDPAWAVS